MRFARRPAASTTDELLRAVRLHGHAAANVAERIAGPLVPFRSAWDDLGPDPYLPARFGRRERRYAAFDLTTPGGEPRPLPARPHVQAPEHNRLFGGLERTFAPVDRATLTGAPLRSFLALAAQTLHALEGAPVRYRGELHLFRVHAAGGVAWPTPEGVHRDGRDWVLVLLVDRRDVRGGRLAVLGPDDDDVRAVHPMRSPFDLAILDDRRVRHVATPIRGAGRRDTLVVTFRRLGDA